MRKLETLQRDMDEEVSEELERIQRHYARRFLAELRAMLKPFNLSRHEVKISSGMGSASLTVNGRVWSHEWEGHTAHRVSPVLCELRTISANLSHKWADWLDGESLTHY